MSLSAIGSELSEPGHDPDRLLAGYRAARAQQALFDMRGNGPNSAVLGVTGYDEFVDATGDIRPSWRELGELIGGRGRVGLDQMRSMVASLVDNEGISYVKIDRNDDTVTNGEGAGVPGPWQLDALPLLISPTDWDTLESGLVQRTRLLDAVLSDLYGPRRALTSGILPPQLLFAHPGYVRAARGIEIPGRHRLFLHGCDVSRAADGSFRVNADWTQAPSGAGYALADRRVVANTIPDFYEQIGPRAASPFAQALRLSLVDAAPEAAEDPVVVVLSPGSQSETAFDQAYLASLLGFPLVENADLVVREGKLWMRSLGTLKRVDVVLRRVDAEYTDPLDLRADSRLGVVGLVEVLRRGAATVVNTLGSGILESPGLMRFLPDLARLLLDETPLLATAPMYWGGIDRERSHLLAHLSSLLVKSTLGGETIVGPTLSARQRAMLAARIQDAPWQWVGQELPQFSSAPADHLPGGLSAAAVGMRLFAVSQRDSYAPMIGGLGYVLAPGVAAYKFNSVAAKDIWVLPPTRANAEVLVSSAEAPPELQPVRPRGAGVVSSPRALSDLFWMGRYSERAEQMARLLTVTRERYHEYRHRQYTDASECVPVLLTALGEITGTDTGADGDSAEMIAVAPTTLWSLTADRRRPGSLAQSVELLGLSARAVRDQLSTNTWTVLASVDRAVMKLSAAPPESKIRGDALMAGAHARTLTGMLALAGVAEESMVHDAGWAMMDTGKRIERGIGLAALLDATMATARDSGPEQTIAESALVACESLIVYRRRTAGQFNVAAMADLVLLDAENPRSLIYQLERIRTNLRTLPGSSGSSRPERLVDEVSARLRRVDPAELENVGPDAERIELRVLLRAVHAALRELSTVITDTQLTVPGGMQPLWGPDELRIVP